MKTEIKTEFGPFGQAIASQWEEISKGELFVVDVDKDLIWETYLSSFPEGTNNIFRERTHHDCSCCRNFVKNLGRVVTIVNNEIKTVWDVEAEYPYNIVSEKLQELVKNSKIVSIFRTKENRYGLKSNVEMINDKPHTWKHFVGETIGVHDADQQRGKYNGSATLLQRGLESLTEYALQSVYDLISDNNIYRGAEFKDRVRGFLDLHKQYHKLSDVQKNLFVWSNCNNGLARFKNDVIGTLVADISDGVDLERAVKSFEAKVAPTNYKRSKSLITPSMIKGATEKLKELDLEDSVNRRFAKISDITVNNVLFVDSSVRKEMKDGGLETLLMEEVKTVRTPKPDKVQDITIDDFMSKVVPTAKSIHLHLKNSMMGNFMSLTAPVNECKNLFKWDNNFAWSYDGNITDSIKQRVKAAGGNIDVKFRTSLAWYNYDDLDIHCKTPSNKHIHYGNKMNVLDVDMNAGGRNSRTPVENLSWKTYENGKHHIFVHNFSKRENSGAGFELEVEFNGSTWNYSYVKPVGSRESIKCLDITITNNKIDIYKYPSIKEESPQKEKWNVKTENLVPVDTILLSPNHWDGQSIGNKHWFFIIKNCINPEKTRGFYNEFLSNELNEHRKVFEVLADKIKCPETEDQLSGLGFSSTKKEEVLMLVDNKYFNIKFN